MGRHRRFLPSAEFIENLNKQADAYSLDRAPRRTTSDGREATYGSE
jgi:hypothetical protein